MSISAERPICHSYSEAMQQFLEADYKREKKIEVNIEHLEDFNEAEVERRQWEDDNEAELKKKEEELEAEVRNCN